MMVLFTSLVVAVAAHPVRLMKSLDGQSTKPCASSEPSVIHDCQNAEYCEPFLAVKPSGDTRSKTRPPYICGCPSQIAAGGVPVTISSTASAK